MAKTKKTFIDMVLCCSLILLTLYLSANNAYAIKPKKNLTVNDIFKPVTSRTKLGDGNNATYTFSGSTADYINYIRLCMATDNTCSGCGTPYATYKMLTSNNGMPYDTTLNGGTAHALQADAIQSYLTNNGYAAGTYYVGLYVQSKDLVCNSNQSYCSTNQDNTNTYLCVQAVSDGTHTTLTRLDNGNAVLSKNTSPYLYVNNGNTTGANANTISVCPIATMDTTSHTFTCSTSNNTMNTAVNLLKGIALDPISAHAYIASQNNSSIASVGCTTSLINGSLTCSTLSNSGTSLNSSRGIAVDSKGENAYIVNGGNTLLKCPITSGAINCSAVTLTGVTLNGATGIAIDSTNSYIYIANAGFPAGVAACNLSTGACTLGNISQISPSYIAINNTNNAIYIGSGTGTSVNVCSITSGTTLSCSNANASFVNRPQGIVLNPAGTMAFIANSGSGNNKITVCSVIAGSPPTLGNCAIYTDTNGTFGTNLQGLAWGNIEGP